MKCSEEIKTDIASNSSGIGGTICTGLGGTTIGSAAFKTDESGYVLNSIENEALLDAMLKSGCCRVCYPPYFIFIAIAVAPWRIIEKLFKKLKKEICHAKYFTFF